MKKYLLFFSLLTCFFNQDCFAQTATYGVPLSIGRNNCGTGTGVYNWRHPNGEGAQTNDSLYFFNYRDTILNRNNLRNAYFPRLRVGNSTFVRSGTTFRDRFYIFNSSVSFNPRDRKIYYLFTDYNSAISPTLRTYVWRWSPDTTFTVGGFSNPPTANLVDTLMSFAFDIGGIAFDNNGFAYQLEFTGTAPNFTSYLRRIDFVNRTIELPNQIDIINGPGGIGKIYNVGSGDITLLPNGQMYYSFNNKMYTPDYGSYQNIPGNRVNSTCLDTLVGGTTLVGLSFADGDLIGAYTGSCTYRRINPIPNPTITTSPIAYTPVPVTAALGVRSVDFAQISSGVGAAKKLVSITPTGTPRQYNVVYDVLVKNYGSVPITNLQVTDNLAAINGLGNLSSVSTTLMTIPPPPGIALNAAYNGSSDINLLQNSGQILPNYPTDSSSFVIRINCTIANVDQGVVYYNSAIATANGFRNVALRDSSNNGDSPDANQNDKPDDVGEGIRTPFLIALRPIPNACPTLTATLYSENFGTGAIGGTGLQATLPTTPNTFSSTYTGSATQPLTNNQFAITTNTQNGNTTNWKSLLDHTVDVDGRMMVFNADAPPRILFRDTLPTSCPGRQYSFSFWATFPFNPLYQSTCDALGGFRYPKLKIQFRDIVTGLTAVGDSTPTISTDTWTQIGYRWTMPVGYSNLILEIVNDGAGGCGNDIAIDDIVYGSCDALPVVNASSITGCLGDSVRFVGSLADSLVLPGPKDHQWQISPTGLPGTWVNISGATSPFLTINPILVADTGKFYRLIVAAAGSISIPICQSISPGVKLNGQVPSIAVTSAGRNKNNICGGIPVKIYRTGGTLGTAAAWLWYTGTPGGTLVGSGDTLTVTPAVTTKYYIRAEGSCNNTRADSVTITINCDIDKDNDGIPDLIESNVSLALGDANSNGIINAYDPTYAGYKDNNNDYINDDFQADGDSDGDGIANFLDTTFPGRVDVNSDGRDDRFDRDLDGIINIFDLDSDNDGIVDVVETGGVDANGDGVIDNYTDTDTDGLSDNVDTRINLLNGAYNTGIGLGAIDLDADLILNEFDADSDNDGIPDVIEALGPDTNNDGIIDLFVDANSDGLHDSYINATGLLRTGADVGGDGRADSYPNKNFDSDLRPNAFDVDSDGDGIVDVAEAGFSNPSLLGWVVGPFGADGWSDVIDAQATLSPRNTDGRGNPNHLDIDSDDDGIPDQIEGQPTANPLPAGYTMAAGTDADNDGLDTQYDNRPALFGGSGITPVNIDGDALPDYLDLDTDADGQPDIIEGNDFNMNGVADDNVTLTLLDTDGDGLDNRFDSSNTTVKGTSYNLSTGGFTAGDPAPGARCPVSRRAPANSDRVWRFSSAVLPVQFLQFTGVAQNTSVQLNWLVITETALDHFEIERSTNNTTYSKIGEVNKVVELNITQGFSYTDDISNVNSELYYYRLKVVSKTGEIKYSNIVVVRKATSKQSITIMPNPAKGFTTIKFTSENNETSTLRLIDNGGRLAHTQLIKIAKGLNTISLNNLSKHSGGMYTVQFLLNNQLVTQKIMIVQ